MRGSVHHGAVAKRLDEADRLRRQWKDDTFLKKKQEQRRVTSAAKQLVADTLEGVGETSNSDTTSCEGDQIWDAPAEPLASSLPEPASSIKEHCIEGEGIVEIRPQVLLGDELHSTEQDEALPLVNELQVEIGGDRCAFRDDHSGGLGVWKLSSSTRRFLSIDRDGRRMDPSDPQRRSTEDEEGHLEANKREMLRGRIWDLMSNPQSSTAAYTISLIINLLIFISCVTLCLDTVEEINSADGWEAASSWIEGVCVVCFTIEYIVKLLTATKMLDFVRSPLNLIDLMAIWPWYFDKMLTFEGAQVPVLRVVRLVRIFRVLKLGERYAKLQIVSKSVKESLDMLMVLLFLLTITILICSSVIYQLERGQYNEEYGYFVRHHELHLVNPETGLPPETPFRSIPETFWFCMVTLMTVGYGDIVPTTAWGKVVAGVVMVISLLILALPISVIGTNFTTAWMDYKERVRTLGENTVPPNVESLEDMLSTHLLNVEDTIKIFAEVEHDLECIRVRIIDKAKTTTTPPGSTGAGAATGKDPAATIAEDMLQRASFAKAFDPEVILQWKREIAVMRQLELKMNESLGVLEDLLVAADLMREDRFTSKVKLCRMKYKQMEFLTEQQEGLQVSLEDLEKDIRSVESSIAHLEHRAKEQGLRKVKSTNLAFISSKLLGAVTKLKRGTSVQPTVDDFEKSV
ncbi:hypothetical protein BSKO_11474 [Bryopsis sp. KO-2023]|nr:hypothetical protein BSKO_11474 [Bryopsis sp. KO-2023]